jgi:hypothetical protein
MRETCAHLLLLPDARLTALLTADATMHSLLFFGCVVAVRAGVPCPPGVGPAVAASMAPLQRALDSMTRFHTSKSYLIIPMSVVYTLDGRYKTSRHFVCVSRVLQSLCSANRLYFTLHHLHAAANMLLGVRWCTDPRAANFSPPGSP